MKFKNPILVSDLFSDYEVSINGDSAQLILGMNEIHRVANGDLMFVDHEKYYDKALDSKASFILIDKNIPDAKGKTLIIAKSPFDIYNSIAKKLKQDHLLEEVLTIASSAKIHPTAKIGNNVVIMENSIIGANVYIGDHVTIQQGCMIGVDAFYYHKKDGAYTKWESIGDVLIKDNVEIGAGTTISRGVSSSTIIGKGTKIDCQVHIGHGAIIGSNCLIAAQVGIGGKTIIKENVTIYGQVGIAQNLTIKANTIIGAKAGVSKSLEGGQTYFGIPARPLKEFYREFVALRNLPSLIKRKKKSD